MFDLTFESMGTHWQISVDTHDLPPILISEIREKTNQFDQQYSRFISTSEANKFRNCAAGNYPVSKDLAVMLQAGQHLLKLTDGAFDLSIATLFEKIGYDPDYNFKKAPDSVKWQPPKWSIQDRTLSIDGPVVFDVGGIGKGYWIDRISGILVAHNFPHHLVEGGGDMFATTKQDRSAWRVAIEYPGKPDIALGMVELENQALAASDIFKRKWKGWNHLVNAKTGKPLSKLLGSVSVAPSAFLADQMTSVLSFGNPEQYTHIATELRAEYLIMKADESIVMSEGWRGEVF